MVKKLSVVLILALASALALGGIAYGAAYAANQIGQSPSANGITQNPTQANPARPGVRRGLGQITVLGENSFTVQTRAGVERVIQVDDQTHYFDAHGASITFADLQTDRWVAGRVISSPAGPLARLVILLPAGFDPNLHLIRHAGTVDGVDVTAGTFQLTTLQGEQLTFQVDENTIYMGQVTSLADLQVGMGALVGAQQQADGAYLAVHLIARQKPQVDVKVAGRVTGIEVSTFTLLGRDGQTYTFQVTPRTRFRGPGLNGLRDLRLGRTVAVAAQQTSAGQFQALVVIGRAR